MQFNIFIKNTLPNLFNNQYLKDYNRKDSSKFNSILFSKQYVTRINWLAFSPVLHIMHYEKMVKIIICYINICHY